MGNMTPNCPEQSHVDPQEAALTMAVAVLAERIRGLAPEDKEDLFDLTKALFNAETTEEVNAAAAGLREILDQAKGSVGPFRVSTELGPGVAKWAEYVGGRIKEARIAAELTQVDLEKITGLPQSHISRLEKAVHTPSNATLEKIAKALNRPLSFFDPMAGEDS